MEPETYKGITSHMFYSECSLLLIIHTKKGEDLVIVIVYVDYLLITGSKTQLITKVKACLHRQFKLKDLCELKFLLGIEVLRSSEGVILTQRKYILELIVDANLTGAKPASTPLESNLRLNSVEH